MASKNEQKIQEIVDAMGSKEIIASNGITITGNQIASTIRAIPKRTSITRTDTTSAITYTAERGYYASDTRLSLYKYTGRTNITPSKSNQSLATRSKYVGSDITILGDAKLLPENIKNGVSIFGVNGTYTGTQSQIPYVSGSISIAQNTSVCLSELIIGTSNINVLTLSGINGTWNIPTKSILTLIWNNNAPPYYDTGLRLLNASAQISPRMFSFEVVSNFTLQG